MDVFEKLGIDWKSLIIYLVNFGIIVAIVARYLWRPIISNLDKRREFIRSNIKESELLKEQFQKELKKKEYEHVLFVQQMQEEMAQAKKHAHEKMDLLLAEAETERQHIISIAKANAAEIQKQALEHLEGDLVKRMQHTILYVLKNKVPEKVIKDSLKEAWTHLDKKM